MAINRAQLFAIINNAINDDVHLLSLVLHFLKQNLLP